MRFIRKSELKGILALIGIALVLGVVFMALTGTLTEWTGIHLTLKEPLADSIVFISDRNGHSDVWVMKPDGSDQKALTNDKFEDWEPVVSPDGYTVVFVSKRDTGHAQLFAIDSDGTHLRRITNMTGAKSAPKFTPDGKEITFLCAGDVWRVGRRGDHPERLLPTEEQEAMAQFSREKSPYQWVGESRAAGVLAAVQSLEEGSIVVWMPPGEKAPQPIVHQVEGAGVPLAAENVCAAWAEDADRLAVTLSSTDGSGVLIVADIENESMSPMLGGGAMGTPAWSPDGSSIAVQALKRNGLQDYSPIALLLIDVYDPKPRVVVSGEVSQPTWSPDGELLCVNNGDIYSVDVESGKAVNLTDGKGKNSDPTWAPARKESAER